MLIELNVSNFAIIDNIHIQFKKGLNVISGETGAGKSIILKSLGLLMGAKSQTESVKTGCEFATIEGLFDLSERTDLLNNLKEIGIEVTEDQLVVRRIVAKHGKSRVYLNGSLSPLSLLKDLIAPLIEVSGHHIPLIEMTGQHENKNLQSINYHLDILDQYAGCFKLRVDFESKYKKAAEIKRQIEALKEQEKIRNQKIDFLQFQFNEIEQLQLSPGEETNIETNLSKLKNASHILEFSSNLETSLYSNEDSVLSQLQSIIHSAEAFYKVDPQLENKISPLHQVTALIEDCVYEIRNYASNINVDDEQKNKWEEKIDLLRKLQKKYGKTVADILANQKDIQAELNGLMNSDEHYKNLQSELDLLRDELNLLALKLHKKRSASASLLTKSVNSELLDLNMKGVQFVIHVSELDSINSTGKTQVEFKTKSSKKDEARSLSKFASGGELSRILLSLKYITGKSSVPRTYLFDEVDAGVSGETAEKVGHKLHSISKGQQVICVTHLPQVAAQGDHHFYICKANKNDQMVMEVLALTKKKDRVNEIARLISGEKITKTSISHAEQLLS
ncbi:MAG: DNA repair protein RecN [Bdellovibrionaceae bacterium]|jgi:DNA repair protein RecN (Recombination protein N)|nr:DNA repair protein RecN [Pseudobdellovibrionaceae bacterium]